MKSLVVTVCRGEFLTQFEGVRGLKVTGCQKGANSIALEHRKRNSVG